MYNRTGEPRVGKLRKEGHLEHMAPSGWGSAGQAPLTFSPTRLQRTGQLLATIRGVSVL